jgi:hypothetical protein
MKFKIQIIIINILFLFNSTYLHAQVVIEGEIDDIIWLSSQIKKLTDNSVEFAQLWKNIEEYNGSHNPKVKIKIQQESKVFLFGTNKEERISLHNSKYGESRPKTPLFRYDAGSGFEKIEPKWRYFELLSQVLIIDKKDIEALPTFERINGDWKVSSGNPLWAITQESVIAHEIAEFFHGLSNNFCKYSCDCHLGKEDDSHDVAKKMENNIRSAFGQKDFRRLGCGEKRDSTVLQLGKHKIKLIVENENLKNIIYKN